MNKRLLTLACLAALLTGSAFAAEETKTPAAASNAPAASAEPPNDTTIAIIS